MDKMPKWADVILTPLISLVLAMGISALVILAIALWCVRVPFAWLLHGHFGANAVWWSFPLGSLTMLLLAAVYYRWGGWRKARLLAHPPRTGMASAPAGAAAPSES